VKFGDRSYMCLYCLHLMLFLSQQFKALTLKLCATNLTGSSINIIFKFSGLVSMFNLFMKSIYNSLGNSDTRNAGRNPVYSGTDYAVPFSLSVSVFCITNDITFVGAKVTLL
jgi:hypothetical protein